MSLIRRRRVKLGLRIDTALSILTTVLEEGVW